MLLEFVITSKRTLRGGSLGAGTRLPRAEITSIERDYEKRAKLSRNARSWPRRINALRKWEKRPRNRSTYPRSDSQRYENLLCASECLHTWRCVYADVQDRFLVTSFLHRVYKDPGPGYALTNSPTDQGFSISTLLVSGVERKLTVE